MKLLIITFTLLNTLCYGQGDGFLVTSGRTDVVHIDSIANQDSLTAEKYFKDSIGNEYMVEYRYSRTEIMGDSANDVSGKISHPMDFQHHHFIANCSLIKYHGNKQQTIIQNYKAIYSPTPCSSDNTELWLKRLYEFQKKK